MKQNTWANITRVLAVVFGIAAVLFLVLSTSPTVAPGAIKQSLSFSGTLFFSGLTIFMYGLHVVFKGQRPQEAATVIFLGAVLVLVGAFFLMFGIEQ